MSFLSDFIGLFRKEQVSEPVINKAISFGGLTLTNDDNLDKYYKIYKKNQFVRSTVVNLMDTIGKGGYKITTMDDDLISESEEMEIKSLFENTEKNTSFKNIKKRIVRDYFVGGNVYVYLIRELDSEGNRSENVIGLQVLDPRYMNPLTDKFGNVYGYIQNLDGNIQAFLPEDIHHLKFDADIEDETVGLPLLTSLSVDLDLDEEAKASNLAFFKNNQTPASIIVLDEGVKREDLEEIRKALQDQFKGGKNHHRGGVMKGVKEIIKVQDKISDAEFLNMRKFTLENVCALFGVPKTILGYTDGVNYSNAQTQFMEYIENTIRPAEETISRFLTSILSSIGYEDVKLSFIDDHIDQLQTKSKTIVELVNNGILDPNEGRNQLGYEERDEEGANNLWIGTNKKVIQNTQNIDNGENTDNL